MTCAVCYYYDECILHDETGDLCKWIREEIFGRKLAKK